MKKSLVAVFSISITAGTIYLGYDQLKRLLIKRFLKNLALEATKRGKEVQLTVVTEELDKLFLWDLRLLDKLLSYIVSGQSAEMKVLQEKIRRKHIMDKADLNSIEELMLHT